MISALQGEEFLVVASFNDFAVFKHQNHICVADGGIRKYVKNIIPESIGIKRSSIDITVIVGAFRGSEKFFQKTFKKPLTNKKPFAIMGRHLTEG